MTPRPSTRSRRLAISISGRRRPLEDRLPVEDRVPHQAVVPAVEVAVERVEVEGHHAAASDGQVEDGRPMDETLLAPGLAAHDERRALAVAPFEHDRTAVLGTVEAGGAVRHAQP